MILVDTGPLAALFDPQDQQHRTCVGVLKKIREPIVTTIPVLTEAFHMLGPASIGSDRLREFIEGGGLAVWCFEPATLTRAFELMERYADHPMDLADASLVAAAESLSTRRVFTIDRNDFETYKVRRGHRHLAITEPVMMHRGLRL
jgi:predicted nucleic acid-binding protein